MDRRTFLRSGAVGMLAVGGCTELLDGRSDGGLPEMLEDRPNAVYYPTHVEGMEMVGTATDGAYAVGVTYSFPHRFWTVSGAETERVDIRDEDDIHLMATVWDAATETALPIASGLSMTIERDGETVAEFRPWEMLSQNMGFHYGDNVALAGEGTYRITVDVPALAIRRLGDFAGKFEDGRSLEFELAFDEDTLDAIDFETLDDRQGERGAVDPMEMEMLPTTAAPAVEDLPGRHVAAGDAGDADVHAVAVDDPDFLDADGTYLAVSPRTPHNQYPLPMAALSLTVDRADATVFDGALSEAIHPELGFHYGTVLERLETGDEGTIAFDSPPQVSRHEGYETAFLELPPVGFTVSE